MTLIFASLSEYKTADHSMRFFPKIYFFIFACLKEKRKEIISKL